MSGDSSTVVESSIEPDDAVEPSMWVSTNSLAWLSEDTGDDATEKKAATERAATEKEATTEKGATTEREATTERRTEKEATTEKAATAERDATTERRTEKEAITEKGETRGERGDHGESDSEGGEVPTSQASTLYRFSVAHDYDPEKE